MDPRRGLHIVTWNCGGLTTQMHAVRTLLLSNAPSILFLQEARSTSIGSYSALRAECGLLGYFVLSLADKQLVAVVRRGLSVALLSLDHWDDLFRIQRLAVLIGGKRLVSCLASKGTDGLGMRDLCSGTRNRRT